MVQEDIQIQVPTARLGIRITLAKEITLDRVKIRARLASPVFGTKTVIERMDMQTLFEYSAQTEGFYRINASGALFANNTFEGHIDIARGGSLALNNSTYISVDITSGDNIVKCEVFSIQHPKTSNTFLHYNPVTVNQALQGIQLEAATDIIYPVGKVAEMQLVYPGVTVTHTADELKFIADMMNDLVAVRTDSVGATSAFYGSATIAALPVRDALSALDASRVQIEQAVNSGSFNIYLVEEKLL